MFRPMRRAEKALSAEATERLLLTERRGVLALNGEDGYPYAIPINFLYCPEEERIWFHGSRAGYKAELLQRDCRVCFTVTGNVTVRGEAWAPYVQSAVLFGRCHAITDPARTRALVRRFAEKYYPDAARIDAELAASGNAVQMYEIEIEHRTGKEIQER